MGALKTRVYPRFGYDLADDGKTLVPNAAEQEAIALILQWRADGKSMNWIANELNRRGIPPKGRGAPKSPTDHASGRWIHTSVALVISRHSLPEPSAAKAIPLVELRDQILSRYESSRSSDSHVRMIRQVFRILLGIEGVRTTGDLTPALLPRFFATFENVTEGSRLTYLGVLKTICRIAVEEGHLSQDPTREHLVPSKKPRDQRLTRGREEVRRVLDHLKKGSGKKGEARWRESRLHAFVATVVYTGLYPVEALGLTVDDCNFENRSIRVSRRKSFKFGTLMMEPSVYIPAELLPILMDWAPQAAPLWLFPNARKTARWNTSGYTREIAAAGEACGITGLTLESLRRFHEDYIRAAARLEDPPDADEPLPLPTAEERMEPVILRSRKEPPIVLGEQVKKPLTYAQYNVIEALLKAGREGLTTPELDEASGHPQADKILRKLIKKCPVWGEVIHFPGEKGHGGMWIGLA